MTGWVNFAKNLFCHPGIRYYAANTEDLTMNVFADNSLSIGGIPLVRLNFA